MTTGAQEFYGNFEFWMMAGCVPSPNGLAPSPCFKTCLTANDAESAKVHAVFEFFAVHPFMSEQECERKNNFEL